MNRIATILIFIFSSIAVYGQEGQIKPQRFSIYFGGGSYYIDEVQAGKLKDFLEAFDSYDSYQVSIHSYTDNIGGAEYNQWLSQMRSQSAIDQLIINNVPEEIISIQDFGQYNPIYDNRTWEGRIKNRRVDIIFWPLAF